MKVQQAKLALKKKTRKIQAELLLETKKEVSESTRSNATIYKLNNEGNFNHLILLDINEEDKVDPSVVEDSAVGGITDGELESKNGDNEVESKVKAEDEDDKENVLNKVQGSGMKGSGRSIPMGLHFSN
jgi:hypothetical protein